MERFIAVDSGKFATKVATYNPMKKRIRKCHFRTKVGKGDFRDDAIEAQTIVTEINGQVYKVGEGADGGEAELTTSKDTETHKICTLVAIALFCSSNEVDEVNVAVGLTAQEWHEVSTREDYKADILPEGEICVKVKNHSTAPIIEKRFIIKTRKAFPESIGALFMDDSPVTGKNKFVGVLDIGNLNLNATFWQGTDYEGKDSITAELGGKILIQTLAQRLSSELKIRCNEKNVAEALFTNPNRALSADGVLDEQRKQYIEEESKKIITRELREHALLIKAECDAKRWSMELTRIVVIGGTGKLLGRELTEVFGNVTVLNESEYCNVLGYLRILCQQILGEFISLEEEKTDAKTAAA